MASYGPSMDYSGALQPYIGGGPFGGQGPAFAGNPMIGPGGGGPQGMPPGPPPGVPPQGGMPPQDMRQDMQNMRGQYGLGMGRFGGMNFPFGGQLPFGGMGRFGQFGQFGQGGQFGQQDGGPWAQPEMRNLLRMLGQQYGR